MSHKGGRHMPDHPDFIASLGDYRVTFGKFYGRRLAEIDRADLSRYLFWLEQNVDYNNEPRVLNFIQSTRRYLAAVTREGRKTDDTTEI